MSIVKNGQKSIRVVLDEGLYQAIKKQYPEHGELSQLVRKLLIKHIDYTKPEEKSDGARS